MPKDKVESDRVAAPQWPIVRDVIRKELDSRGLTLGRFCKDFDLPTSTVFDVFDAKKTDVRFGTLQMILQALGWDLVRLGRQIKAATAAA